MRGNLSNLPTTAKDAVRGRDLSGQVHLVTGGYSGLGAAAARALLTGGATVIVAGRNPKSQAAFVEELIGEGFDPSRIDASATVDLGDLSSVRAFSKDIEERYPAIDVLMNNAGIMNTPYGVTKDGFEVQFGTNVVGHFLLAKRLAPRTKRQVWLSSRAHLRTGATSGDVYSHEGATPLELDAVERVDEATYDGWRRYQQSKLANILLAKQFPAAFQHIEAASVHPGIVRTNLSRHLTIWSMLPFIFRALTGRGQRPISPEVGARTQTLIAVLPSEQLMVGAYYADAAVAREADAANDMTAAKALYDYCDRVTADFQA